ncbi:hypothetical protein F2Q70_00013847 [Brassica cretica]|uniref:Uncharacterized protein n=1 Tax=Brassica cretica TaxID=69181 RepID=A0A8S9LXR5_BRACR|nr:hypothetical protein F2Q70_00013847 [Brassica cretica]
MDPRVPATSVFRWSRSRRKIHIRRRKTQVVRLGEKNNVVSRGGFSLKKMVRRMKLRWLRLHYVRLVKNIFLYLLDYYNLFTVQCGTNEFGLSQI